MNSSIRAMAAALAMWAAAEARAGGVDLPATLSGLPPVPRNALAAEDSVYLRSLSSSPVEWRAWGPGACAEARASGKPIFLSIGYASCLWSARVDRGLFSDTAVARRLNAACVPVKVDRFEYPDLDRWCQRATEAAGQPGGWPLNVWMSPEGLPVRTVTIPSGEDSGPEGFLSQIDHFLRLWVTDSDYLRRQARRDAETLAGKVGAALAGLIDIDAELLALGRGQTLAQFDPVHGGFGRVPKFATPARLAFLMLQAEVRDPSRQPPGDCLAAVTFSLDALARGGLRDHVGGGFFRYAQDEGWTRPYFEKLALDQALVTDAFLSAHRLTGHATYAEVVRDTLSYALRELSHPEGGFYNGEQAESGLPPDGPQEGGFYLWTPARFAEAAGADADLLATIYGFQSSNGRSAAIGPSALGEAGGLPVPVRTLEESAASLDLDQASAEASWRAGRRALLASRSLRPRPALDRLQTAQTTAAFISTLCRASIQLNEPEWLERARQAAAFFESTFWDAEYSRVFRAFLDRPPRLPGVAEDYAYCVRALLDLHETTGEFRWLGLAEAVQRRFDQECGDAAGGGWFDTAHSAGRTLCLKTIDDAGAFAPNAIAGANAVRQSVLFADPEGVAAARRALGAFAAPLRAGSPSVAGLLGVAHSLVHPPRRIVLFGPPELPELREARARLAAAPPGRWCVLSVENDQALDWLIQRGALPPTLKASSVGKSRFFVDGDTLAKENGRSLQELHKFL